MVKRFLFLLYLLSIFCFCNVYAYNSTFVPNLVLPPYTILGEWNTDTSYTTISMGFQSDSTNSGLDSQKAFFYEHMAGQSNDWNGTSIVFSTDNGFIANNSYNMSFILCSQNSLVIDRVNIGTSTGPWSQALAGNWATINNWSVTTISDYSSDAMSFSPCRNVVVNFTAKYTGSFVALRFRSQNNSSFGNFFAFMGYIYDNEGKNYTTFFNEINDSINNLNSNLNNKFNDLNSNINNQFNDLNSNISNESDKIQDSVNDLNSTIEDNTVSDPNFSEYDQYLAENGVITQLITLPVQLYTKILNGINGTCSTFNLGNLWGSDLNLPCIQPKQYLGDTLWNTIDVLFSGFFIYVISKKMINVFEQFTNLKEGDILD